jgi:translation elongation factor P/translation initiation factor 5A
MKSFFITVIAAALLIACNNSEENTSGTSETSHDSHATSTLSSVEMPAMPEVPANARVFFANLKDGQTVTSPLKVEMGVEAMAVDTANGILKPASGHHHILVDMDSVTTGEVIKKDSVHLHFGNAQTSAEIKLPPGKHSLTLQFADAMHRSYGSRLTSKVTVEVKK